MGYIYYVLAIIVSIICLIGLGYYTLYKVTIRRSKKFRSCPQGICNYLSDCLEGNNLWRSMPILIRTSDGISRRHYLYTWLLLGRVKKDVTFIKGCSARVPLWTVRLLANVKDIDEVIYDRKVRTCLDLSSQHIKAPQVWDNYYTGKGQTIAILDTGVYPHPDFRFPEDRIIHFVDLVGKRTSPYDDNGHGTHVSGDAAGNGSMSQGKYKGIAPDANIIVIKVLDKNGGGRISQIINGLQWVAENKDKYNIKVVSMSLGSPALLPNDVDPLNQAAEALWDSGVVVVAAAGNEGPDAETISSPGNSPKIITVGAVDIHRVGTQQSVEIDHAQVPAFSSRGPTVEGLGKPDVLAPGVDIWSTKSNTKYLPARKWWWCFRNQAKTNSTLEEYYTVTSGTSMATPMVAGAIALYLEKYPDATPDQVKEKLLNSCYSLGLDPNVQGRGVVQLDKFLE